MVTRYFQSPRQQRSTRGHPTLDRFYLKIQRLERQPCAFWVLFDKVDKGIRISELISQGYENFTFASGRYEYVHTCFEKDFFHLCAGLRESRVRALAVPTILCDTYSALQCISSKLDYSFGTAGWSCDQFLESMSHWAGRFLTLLKKSRKSFVYKGFLVWGRHSTPGFSRHVRVSGAIASRLVIDRVFRKASGSISTSLLEEKDSTFAFCVP